MCRPLQRYAGASEAGFRAGGWPGALRTSIEVSLAQRKAKSGYVSPYVIAQLYANLGDKEHAFEWLNAAFQEHDISIISLRRDFSMDPLRSDPRYIELVRKVGYRNRDSGAFSITPLLHSRFQKSAHEQKQAISINVCRQFWADDGPTESYVFTQSPTTLSRSRLRGSLERPRPSGCRSFFLSPSILENDSVLCRQKQPVLPA
jgi:hypothetical protein